MAHNFVVFNRIEQEKRKEPAEQRSSSHTSPLAPYAVVSSTNSKAHAPNPNNRLGEHPIRKTPREAFPTATELAWPEAGSIRFLTLNLDYSL